MKKYGDEDRLFGVTEDKRAWYDTWRENIDYRIDSGEDASIHAKKLHGRLFKGENILYLL